MKSTPYKKRWGDRKDAARVRDIDGMHAYMAYLMPRRTEAEVYLNEAIDVTALLPYIAAKNQRDPAYKTTLFHCLLMAVARTVQMRPLFNRYVSNKRFYQRHRTVLGFVIKKRFTDSAQETLMLFTPEDSYTVDDITRAVVDEARAVRRDQEASHGPDSALNFVKHLPRPLMSLLMGVVRFADAHGLMPQSLMDVDSNYATVLLSNLGSIRCNAVYHHLNNMGTNSIVLTVGEIHKDWIPDADGNPAARDVVNIGVTVDERIADGFYFARSLKLIKHLFAHPELLDLPLNEPLHFHF